MLIFTVHQVLQKSLMVLLLQNILYQHSQLAIWQDSSLRVMLEDPHNKAR